MNRYISEFIGTFFLVLAITMTGDPLVIGITLSIMVYAGANVSGSHFNPAVTFGLLLKKKISVSDSVAYWVSQVLGALVAMAVFVILKDDTFIPKPAADATAMQTYLVEIIGTFALVYVIFQTAVCEKATPNSYFGLCIGMTIFCVASMGGAISGGAFNPAVYFGPAIYGLFTGGGVEISNLLLYLIGPMAGGALAAVVYCKLCPTCE